MNSFVKGPHFLRTRLANLGTTVESWVFWRVGGKAKEILAITMVCVPVKGHRTFSRFIGSIKISWGQVVIRKSNVWKGSLIGLG